MDPLDQIAGYKDSSVAMMRAGARQGYASFYMGADDLFVEGGHAWALSSAVTLKDDDQNWCDLGPKEPRRLSDFGLVVMRKDPPVDKRFIHACHMLEHAVRDGARVQNNPSALIGLNEKLFALQFPELCPATVGASDLGVLRKFLDTHKKIIMKPLDAMGGAGVFMVTHDDVNFEVIWELQTLRGTYPVIAQAFIPEITDGDKRILVINGKAFPHVLVRTPKSGSIRGNMAAGGTTHVREISKAEQKICDTIAPALIKNGISFAGIDVIGDKLIEINITSPTGIVQIAKGCGVDVASQVLDGMLKI